MSNSIYGYTFICYPESCELSVLKYLMDRFPMCYILHDKDTMDNGDLKKPHYHLYVQSKLNSKQLTTIMNMIHVNHYEPIKSGSGMFQYLTHENCSGKYHYSKEDIVMNEEFDSSCLKVDAIKETDIITYAMEYNVSEITEVLQHFGMDNYYVIKKCYNLLNLVLTSNRYNKPKKHVIDYGDEIELEFGRRVENEVFSNEEEV